MVMDKLIDKYEIKLVEAGCAPVSGRYGWEADVPNDISPVFPYLNALLAEARYDHQEHILIWRETDRAYALRPYEIKIVQADGTGDPEEGRRLVGEIVERINRVWQDREHITPRFKETARPSVIDIFKLLPKTNCKQCGYATCLVYAADLRVGKTRLEKCLPLVQPEHAENRKKLAKLISGE
ncbi:MAG: (Fe-S)-binding protein [Chloroflexota bacterium]